MEHSATICRRLALALALMSEMGMAAQTAPVLPNVQVAQEPLVAMAKADSAVLLPQQTATLYSASRLPPQFAGKFRWSQIKGAQVNLQNPDRPEAKFSANTPGEYGFKLTVSDGRVSSSDTVTIQVSLPKGVTNGDFSTANPAGLPLGWWLERTHAKAKVEVDPKGGEAGTAALRITTEPMSAPPNNTGEYALVRISQSVQLEPYRVYRLRARMRGVNLLQSYWNDNSPEYVGPSVGVNMWMAESFRNQELNKKLKGTFGWTDVDLEFPTLANGRQTIWIHCGRGAGNAPIASGTLWIDNVHVELVPDQVPVMGEHAVLFFSKQSLARLKPGQAREMVDEIDAYANCISDLTGKGQSEKTVFFAPWTWDIWAGAWSGNPVLLSGGGTEMQPWQGKLRDLHFMVPYIHELSHNLGVTPVGWGEIAPGTLAYYAVGELGLRGGPNMKKGMELVQEYHAMIHQIGAETWRKEKRINQNRIQDKFMIIARRIGWQRTWATFRQVFRMVLITQEPTNPHAKLWKADVDFPGNLLTQEFADAMRGNMWQQFKAFFDAASAVSGFDMWSVFSKGEIRALQTRLVNNDLGD